jgi:hypothetical protein
MLEINQLEMLLLEKQHNQLFIKAKKAYTDYGIGLFKFCSKNQSRSYSSLEEMIRMMYVGSWCRIHDVKVSRDLG